MLLDREALAMTFNDQFLTLALIIAASAFAILALRPRPDAPVPDEAALAH
jgi:hypothetical protein